MNANDNLERGIADVYEREAPKRAPDWVLASALDAIEVTPQRRVLVPAPWRFTDMNTFAKVAIAAVIVLAIGAVGLSVLMPRSSSSVGNQPSASPSPATSADPSAPPPLSSTFTSTMHGISTSYPTGWQVAPATQPWLPGGNLDFMSTASDHLYDGTLQDHLFLSLASQPLGGKTGAAWTTDLIADPEQDCPSGLAYPVTVDGADGLLCGGLAAVSTGDRGYAIRLYTSGDEPSVSRSYDDTWFKSVLATVQLRPENALTPSSPPPLGGTFTSQRNGISIQYPTGWATAPATAPWTGGGVSFPAPDLDYTYDGGLSPGDLFFALASMPLSGKGGETWARELLADPEQECAPGTAEPLTVDGANGLLCGQEVAVWSGDRGYFIRLFTSDAVKNPSYDDAWFRSVIATVQLQPENAVDTPAS